MFLRFHSYANLIKNKCFVSFMHTYPIFPVFGPWKSHYQNSRQSDQSLDTFVHMFSFPSGLPCWKSWVGAFRFKGVLPKFVMSRLIWSKVLFLYIPLFPWVLSPVFSVLCLYQACAPVAHLFIPSDKDTVHMHLTGLDKPLTSTFAQSFVEVRKDLLW